MSIIHQFKKNVLSLGCVNASLLVMILYYDFPSCQPWVKGTWGIFVFLITAHKSIIISKYKAECKKCEQCIFLNKFINYYQNLVTLDPLPTHPSNTH